tara:strand:- start:5878 stop:6279 length:402 start_codon:yes stop_codon:yes gene_type:complete
MAGKRSKQSVKPTRHDNNHKIRISKVTGKPFNKQNPEVRRHGPQRKHIVYRYAIEQVLNLYLDNEEWLTAKEIAYHANEHVSNFWTQLSTFSVGAILREYEKDNLVISRKKSINTPKKYKALKKITKHKTKTL